MNAIQLVLTRGGLGRSGTRRAGGGCVNKTLSLQLLSKVFF